MLSLGAFGSATLTIADGGKVNSTFSSIGEYAGSNGVVTITGANSALSSPGYLYLGGAAVGVINLGSAQGSAASKAGKILGSQLVFGTSGGTGTLVFNHTGSAYGFSLAMATGSTGSANTIKQIAGTTLLSGDSSTFNGTTNVSGGSLRVNGKLAGTVNVSGGSLGGTGQLLGTVNVASGGTFAPGSSIGTTSVAGNVNFASGSVLAVEVDAAGNADKLVVGGTVNVTSGANVAVSAASGTYLPQTSYTILSATGGISGTFGVTTDYYFLTPSLVQSGNDLVLTMTRTATGPATTIASLAGTANQGASGAVIDSFGAGNAIYDASMPVNQAEAKQLLGSATGEVYAKNQQVIDQTFGQFNTAMSNRQAQAGAGMVQTSAPLGYVASVATPASTAIANATTTNTPSLAYWLAPVVAIGRNSDDGMGGAVNWATGGLTLGVDQSMQLDDGSAYAGLALGYLRSQSKSTASTVTTDSGQFGVYGGIEAGAVQVSGSLAYGLAQSQSSRTISGGGVNRTATSTALTHSLGGTVELAYGLR